MKAIHNATSPTDLDAAAVVNIVKSKNESNSQQTTPLEIQGIGCCKYR